MEKKTFTTVSLRAKFKRHHFEALAEEKGLHIAGIDEVGRGPGAGPVLAAAVVLHPQKRHKLLIDSKALSAEERNEAYIWLLKHSWHGWASVSARLIDTIGITEATKLAMERAFHSLCYSLGAIPAAVLVDAVPVSLPFLRTEISPLDMALQDPLSLWQGAGKTDPLEVLTHPWNSVIAFNHGETQSRSIAAASIIAKVTRDRIMRDISASFPAYHFELHKGYNTALHKTALHRHGISILHRRLWKSNVPIEQTLSMLDEHAASMPFSHEIPED